MSALSRIEGLLKDVVERPVWLLSANRIHPVEIAQALSTQMEQNILVLEGERTAPDRYEVHLHPDNFSHFDRAQAHLEQELASYLREVATERRWRFATDTAVKLRPSSRVHAGEVAAYSRFSEVLRDRKIENVADQTAAISLEEVQRLAYVAARLTVAAPGPNKGKSFQLSQSPFKIGRSPDNDAQVEDLRLSRQHAEISFDSRGAFWIRDLGSTNGTFVNGRQTEGQTPIRQGDKISLGGLDFKLATR
ncbi:MAG TPA: FhaA domain-containing protein [Dehalococcoidia bacterium]|nr:FhaA domain-containing protein [Dehalococcoidia bacterium]